MHEYYSVIKKNEIMPFAAAERDLEMVILIESEILYDVPYMWNLKRCELTYKTERNREKTYGFQGEGRGEMIGKKFGMMMYTLLCLKWISNKDLL